MYRGSRGARVRARGSVYGSVRGFCSTCAVSAVFEGNGSVYGSVAEGKWPKMVDGSVHGSVYGSVGAWEREWERAWEGISAVF